MNQNEKLKLKINQAYGELIENIKEIDFTNACIEGARIGFADEIKETESLYNSSIETEKKVNELEEARKELYRKVHENIIPNITKETFMFPKGEPQEIYEQQLAALQYANIYNQNYELMTEAVSEYANISKDFKDSSKKIFDCSVCIHSEINTEKLMDILKNVIDEKVLKNLSSDNELNVDYETAKTIKATLLQAGIKATIKNKVYEPILKNNYEKQKDKFNRQCTKIREEIAADYKPKQKKPVWDNYIKPIIIGFSILFFPLLTFLGIGHAAGGVSLLAFLLPPFLSSFSYLFCGIGIYYGDKKIYNNQIFLEQQAIDLALEATQTVISTLDSQFDINHINNEVDKIVEELYEQRRNTLQKIKEVYELLAITYETVSKEYKETIVYLPPALNLATLPRIIVLMEKGAATDYKTAVWQVEQELRTDEANEKKLAILQAAQEARQAELRAQRFMQEYYEQERLKIAQEQAASQKRTEELAKQQADAAAAAARAAERNAEASEAAIKAAEKQAENTEELLRRSNDPYYINMWKNGQ